MKKIKLDAYALLSKIKQDKPLIHHLTNWVTIYDCANIVKTLGASPVMAHAKEEVAQMTSIASALVLNIGTLTVDFIEAMKIAANAANKKGIPVILDVCGAGATELRDKKSLELLTEAKINIIKGNASEIARISGEDVATKGVDASSVDKNMVEVAKHCAKRYNCTVVVTGKEDIVTDGTRVYLIKNGDALMTHVVGTGCMAASVIGTFAAIEDDLVYSSVSALVCFEIAAELAAKMSKGPATFKEKLLDTLFSLDKKSIDKLQRIEG